MRLVVEGSEEAIQEMLGNLRSNLETVKKTRSLTNKELGMFAQVGEKTAWSWFKQGREPYISNIAPIAKALDIPYGDLFLEPAEFTKRYGAGDVDPLLLAVVSSPRSSQSSKAGKRSNRAMREYLEVAA